MSKRKIVKTVSHRLVSKDMDAEVMQLLADLQAKHPELEWDFNLYGIQFNTYISFRGYETLD